MNLNFEEQKQLARTSVGVWTGIILYFVRFFVHIAILRLMVRRSGVIVCLTNNMWKNKLLLYATTGLPVWRHSKV